MISLIFALPIIVADVSKRIIPNIYLVLYGYLYLFLTIFRGLGSPTLILMFLLCSVLLHLCGMGMGDSKLIFLIVLVLPVVSLMQFLELLTLIFLAGAFHIFCNWLLSQRFPATIAMAPAIFIGTGLYLATSRG